MSKIDSTNERTTAPNNTTLPGVTLADVTLPGVLVSIFEHGCLITGPSQSGKSELALALIDRGHALVADDAVELHTDQNGAIVGQAPNLLQNRLHIRDLGVIDIKQAYGQAAVKKHQKLNYIIALHTDTQPTPKPLLTPLLSHAKILGKSIPKLELSVNNQRNLALILETFVKTAIMSQSGMHPAKQLLRDHQYQIEENHT